MRAPALTVITGLAFGLSLAWPAAQNPQQTTPAPGSGNAAEVVNPAWPLAPVRAAKGMVVSDEQLGCDAGVEILKKGGNAIDAAVAVAFALAVVQPQVGNIGGGGFMLVRLAGGRTGFVDYREVAPGRATRAMYVRSDGSLDAKSATLGYRSAGVPGTVAGLELALRTYGTMKLPDVMAPAIRLAEHGFPVSEKLAHEFQEAQDRLSQFPASRRIFLNNGAFYKPGEVFRQPELAATLRRIEQHGADEFYRGPIAQQIASEMAERGGLITLEDLAAYRAKIREPLRAIYQVNSSLWEVITSPPPSSGGIAMIEALNILAPVTLKTGAEAWSDAENVHWVAEALRRVFADRAAYLADADFAHVPVKGLIDRRYAAQLRATIQPQLASSSREVQPGNPMRFDSGAALPASGVGNDTGAAIRRMLRESERSGHTTHFSIVDAAGNAVANTYTLNDSFGSAVTLASGFVLNDTMDDFTSAPEAPNKLFDLIQSQANSIEPRKRPLSSMTPTILLRDGRLSFVTGSPGGPHIISATTLSVMNWMRLGMDAQQAINAPRFHHQWIPDVLYVEPTLPATEIRDLERRGYTVKLKRWIGQVNAVAIDVKTGERLGAPDARRQGVAAGYPVK